MAKSRRRRGVALIVVGGAALATAAVRLATGGDSPAASDEQTTAATTGRRATTTLEPVTAEDAVAFVGDLMRAVNRRDVTFLVDRLDPVVTGLYGTAACESHIRDGPNRSAVTVKRTEGPETYVWKVDGLAFSVRKVWNVKVDDTTTGRTVSGAVHVGTANGAPTWFVDCGTPLPQGKRRLPEYETEA